PAPRGGRRAAGGGADRGADRGGAGVRPLLGDRVDAGPAARARPPAADGPRPLRPGRAGAGPPPAVPVVLIRADGARQGSVTSTPRSTARGPRSSRSSAAVAW